MALFHLVCSLPDLACLPCCTLYVKSFLEQEHHRIEDLKLEAIQSVPPRILQRRN